jgi:HAMP domain-containing protein
VILLTIVSAFVAARIFNEKAVNPLVQEQVNRTLATASARVAETFDAYMTTVEGTVQILVEAIQDRIVGYPSPGWENDEFVPFVDMDYNGSNGTAEEDPNYLLGRRAYPLNVKPPPLEWEQHPNINTENAFENLQERVDWVSKEYFHHASTASASYFMQGACDPIETDPESDVFFPNCTAEHNNVATGGVIRPTATNYHLWRKSGDLGVFMKALFEAQPEALFVMIAFFNDGAGSLVTFPGNPIHGNNQPYVSAGCEWMRKINPHTDLPFGTEEMIQRCHPRGKRVPPRLYNPMETAWCQQFALSIDPDHRKNHGGRVEYFGPTYVIDVDDPVLIVGKSVFDQMYAHAPRCQCGTGYLTVSHFLVSSCAFHRTGAFIGCVALVLELSSISEILASSKITNSSFLSIACYETGNVLTDSHNSVAKTGNTSLHIADSGIVMQETFTAFQEAINFSAPWTPESVEATYQSFLLECVAGATIAYPLPLPPDEYDPTYKPIFLLINAIGNDVFVVITEMDRTISDDVVRTIICSLALGLLGFLVLLLIVWCVSRMLTRPLQWMDDTTQKIIARDTQREDIATMIASDFDRHDDESSASPNHSSTSSAILHCSPRSEVNELVEEFRLMIQNFSGIGPASVAETSLEEIKNNLTWHSEFHQLYSHGPESSPSPARPLSATILPPSARGVESDTTFRLLSPEGGKVTAARGTSNGTKRTDEHSSSRESQNRTDSDEAPSPTTAQENQDGLFLSPQEASRGNRMQHGDFNVEQSPVTRNSNEARPKAAEELEPPKLQDILQDSRSPQQATESQSSVLIVPGSSCRLQQR